VRREKESFNFFVALNHLITQSLNHFVKSHSTTYVKFSLQNYNIKRNLAKPNVFINVWKVYLFNLEVLVMPNEVITRVNTQGQVPPNYYAQLYANQAGVADLADDTFVGMNPLCGSGSVFGGSYGMGMGSMGMGYGPGSEVMNMSQIDYLKYQETMENFQLAKQGRQKKALEFAEFASTAADDVIARQTGILQRQVRNNEQDYVMGEYNKLTEAVKAKFKEAGYVNVPEAEVKAHAERLYYQATGKSITDDLQEHGDSSFVQGLKQGAFGLGWLVANNKNYKDNISDMTGEPQSVSDKIWKYVGIGVSALLTGGLAIFGAIKGTKGLKGIKAKT